MSGKNMQLETWEGEFGDDYTERNMPDEKNIQQRMIFMSGMLSTLPPIPYQGEPKSILEVGANVGANLKAIDNIHRAHNKTIELYAVEPNKKARDLLKRQDIQYLKIIAGDATNIKMDTASVDVVFTCGVLIHIHPDNLQKAMGEMYRVSKKYIMCAEYFSPEPKEIRYRDRDGLLWTRDFGDTWLNSFPGLRCCGYSFAWKRFTGMDNLVWFTFEKVH